MKMIIFNKVIVYLSTFTTEVISTQDITDFAIEYTKYMIR